MFRAGSREKVLAKVTRKTRAEQRHSSEEGSGCARPMAGAQGTIDLDTAGDESTHSGTQEDGSWISRVGANTDKKTSTFPQKLDHEAKEEIQGRVPDAVGLHATCTAWIRTLVQLPAGEEVGRAGSPASTALGALRYECPPRMQKANA